MKWVRFRVKTITEAEDIVISTLYDLGLEGAQVEDKIPLTALEKEQMFVDILPESEEDDGVAYLNFFVEETDIKTDKSKLPLLNVSGDMLTAEEICEKINTELSDLRSFGIDIGEGTINIGETEDIDWVNNWKQYFHQFTVDDILIVPSWEDVDPKEDHNIVLHIDPGTAFGTGAHETTKLCIHALKKYVKEKDEILDVGTGSGILSILALKFGAEHALGTDLDPCTIEAVSDNKERNDIAPGDLELVIGNIIDDKKVKDAAGYGKYDIVLANILADVLVPLTGIIPEHLKDGGIYITSGIIEGKEQDVRSAMEKAGLSVIDETSMGEWRCLVAKK